MIGIPGVCVSPEKCGIVHSWIQRDSLATSMCPIFSASTFMTREGVNECRFQHLHAGMLIGDIDQVHARVSLFLTHRTQTT
eukprot:3634966-Amphidinium_carterae.1